jgi:hypothetical protein
MNAIAIAPEVHDFLDVVRAQLADLDPDEQRDILDGLEADLTDLVTERGADALGDPVAYACELRAAAGLEPETGPIVVGRARRSPGEAVTGVLDAARTGFAAVVDRFPRDVSAALSWLRPLWWILRGWAAVEVVDMYGGRPRMNAVPDMHGLGWLLCVVGIAGSIAVGRGRAWPGGDGRGPLARTVLLALNLFAVVVTPIAVAQVADGVNERYDRGVNAGYQAGASDRAGDPGTDRAGLYADGKWVSNIYPYDANGRPLVGVQLFNQIGQPINVITQPEYKAPELEDNGNEIDENGNPVDPGVARLPRIFYPWSNGATQLLNVFPIPSRLQDSEEPSATAFTDKVRPALTPYPFARVPAVSLPGIPTGRQQVAVAPPAS